jgi:hypothetical protein
MLVLDLILYYIDHYVKSGTIKTVVNRNEETNIVTVTRDVSFLRDLWFVFVVRWQVIIGVNTGFVNILVVNIQ